MRLYQNDVLQYPLVNTVAAPNRSPAPDESVADTTAAITKPAIIGGMRVSATVATRVVRFDVREFSQCYEAQYGRNEGK